MLPEDQGPDTPSAGSNVRRREKGCISSIWAWTCLMPWTYRSMRWRDDKECEEEHTIASLGILNLNEDPDPVSPTFHLHKALDACLSMACTNDLTSCHTISNILMMLTQLSPGNTNLDASIRTALSILPYYPGLAQEELDRIPNADVSLILVFLFKGMRRKIWRLLHRASPIWNLDQQLMLPISRSRSVPLPMTLPQQTEVLESNLAQ